MLDSIDSREIGLPDFQRDFVSEPNATRELIVSIANNYPAGSLLQIRNSGRQFRAREFAGAPAFNKTSPSYLVLDGQQRLTSLYQALYGVGEFRFFMRMGDLLNNGSEDLDLEDHIIFLRKKPAGAWDLKAQARDLILPLQVLFGQSGGFHEWLDAVLVERTESGEEARKLKSKLRKTYEKWVKPIEEYEFPVVTLSEKTSIDGVCRIFETLNRTGVKLTVFELLTARFWVQNVNLREEWDNARGQHPILEQFKIDPYLVLQTIVLLAGRRSPTRGMILKLSAADINQYWGRVTTSLAEILKMLRGECGVLTDGQLSYGSALLPMTAVWASGAMGSGPSVAANKAKLQRRYWCVVFSQRYDNSSNTKAIQDFLELEAWLKGGKPPAVVEAFKLSISLRDITYRQRALYRGVMALILRHKAQDFHTKTPIQFDIILDGKINDHHVFPAGFLKKIGVTEWVDCVLNRSLIDEKTNNQIRARAPSVYLGEMKEQMGEQTLNSILVSHLLPADQNSGLWSDDFHLFLNERESLILDEITKVTA